MGRKQQVTGRKLSAVSLETLHQILPGHLSDFTRQLQFEKRREDFEEDISASRRSTISSICVASSASNRLKIFFSCGGSPSSGNRDAEDSFPDSGDAAGVSVSLTSAGRSSHTSSQVATSFAPCLISVFGPQEFLFVTFPGTAKTSRFCSSAQRAVMRVPEYSAASTTSTPTDIPLKIRLRIGKFGGAANVPIANSETIAPPSAKICSANREFSFGYITSTPVPNTATVLPFAAIAPRWLAVSTPRAIPLIMTSPWPARSHASRSAIPDPYAVGCRVPTMAIPGCFRTSGFPRT